MGKNGLFRVMMVVVAVALISVGCAKKPKIHLENLRDGGGANGATGMPTTANVDGFSVDGDFANNGQPNFSDGNSAGQQNAGGANGTDGRWSDTKTPLNINSANDFLANAQPWNEKVYFDYNRSEIKPSQREVLDRLAAALSKNNKGVVIEGHCDERGSAEYNRGLSERRALAIREYLHDLGIDNARMQTLSYGIDRPEIPNAKTEAEHSKNRRGQFLVGDKK